MTLLADKVAIVTGAAGGIGRATALALAAQKAAVVAVDIDEAGARATATRISDDWGIGASIAADVTRDQDMSAAVAFAASHFGGLHIAVNVAGGGDRAGPLATLDEADFDHMIGLNLKSVFLAMRHQLARMVTQDSGGVIINISSTAGLRGVPNASLYSAAKHGVIGLTKCSALDYAKHRIRVNAVCPGAIATPQFDRVLARKYTGLAKSEALARIGQDYPLGRIGIPEEVASLIVWLAGDQASYITGQAFTIDGGRTAQ